MILYLLGVPMALLGLTMMTRGWIYTFRPDGPMAEKRKKRNLQRGFTTDMKLFGRKVRRLGLMIALVGGVLVGWQASHQKDEVDAATTSTTTPKTTQPPVPPG